MGVRPVFQLQIAALDWMLALCRDNGEISIVWSLDLFVYVHRMLNDDNLGILRTESDFDKKYLFKCCTGE